MESAKAPSTPSIQEYHDANSVRGVYVDSRTKRCRQRRPGEVGGFVNPGYCERAKEGLLRKVVHGRGPNATVQHYQRRNKHGRALGTELLAHVPLYNYFKERERKFGVLPKRTYIGKKSKRHRSRSGARSQSDRWRRFKGGSRRRQRRRRSASRNRTSRVPKKRATSKSPSRTTLKGVMSRLQWPGIGRKVFRHAFAKIVERVDGRYLGYEYALYYSKRRGDWFLRNISKGRIRRFPEKASARRYKFAWK